MHLCLKIGTLYFLNYNPVNFFSKQIFRVFLALTEDPKDRGLIVAQGGGKVSHMDTYHRDEQAIGTEIETIFFFV